MNIDVRWFRRLLPKCAARPTVHRFCTGLFFCLSLTLAAPPVYAAELSDNPYGDPQQFTVFPSNQLTVFVTNWDHNLMRQINLTLADPENPDLSNWTQTTAADYDGTLPGNPNIFGGIGGRLETPDKDSVIVTSYFDSASGQSGSASNQSIALSPNPDKIDLQPLEGSSATRLATTTALVNSKLSKQSTLRKSLVTSQLAVSDLSAKLQISVVNYDLSIMATHTFDVSAVAGGRIGLDAGDLDGDGLEEIVVTYQGDANSINVGVFKLDNQESSSNIIEINTISLPVDHEQVRDVIVGDFNTDYTNEIIVLSIKPNDGAENFQGKINSRALYLTAANTLTKVGEPYNLEPTALLAPNLDAEASLMQLDGNLSNPLIGRQMVVGFVNVSGDLQIMNFSASIDKQANMFNLRENSNLTTSFEGSNPVRSTHGPFLAAGNFRGIANVNGGVTPTSQVAVVTAVPQGFNTNTTASPQLHIFDNSNGTLSLVTQTPIKMNLGEGIAYVDAINIFPSDFEGKSLYLGTPIHLNVDQLIDPRYVIMSPPKHVDFLPTDPGNPENWKDQGKWEITNVSAFSDFNVELRTSESGTILTSSKDQTTASTSSSKSYNVATGGAAKFAGYGPFKVTGDYSNIITNSASNTETVHTYITETSSTELLCQTNFWDQIVGYHRSLDIWRYPIYNLPGDTDHQDEMYPFLEIVLPGSVSSGPDDNVSGISASWYQPKPIINNILSYPQNLDSSPDDLGEFTWDKDGETQHVKGWLAQRSLSIFGNKQTVTLKWGSESGGDVQKSYDTTYAKSETLKTGFSASRQFGYITMNGGGDVSYNWTDKSSWSQSSISNTKLATSRGITLNIPAGEILQEGGYNIQTGAYISGHGELKVIHSADIPDGSRIWWGDRYGTRPDPALNLPKRIFSGQKKDTWSVSKDPNQAQQMRMFTVQYADPNPLTGELEYIGTGLVEGDDLLLTATVYNLSLHLDPVENLKVNFEYQQMDAIGSTKIGDPVLIQSTSIERLDSRQTVDTQVKWTISGLEGKHIRIYVTLDPDNTIDEIHELGAIASNNVGYWPAGTAYPVASRSTAVALVDGADISADENSLAIETSGQERLSISAIAQPNQLHQVVAQFHSTHASRQHRIVEFYEGNPDEGGNMFGSEILYGVTAGLNRAVTNWMADDASVNELWFRVLESDNEAILGNAQDNIRVHFQP